MIHRCTSIDLSPITVLIGPNGGGKSALFDAILNFSMLSRGSIKQAFGHFPYSYNATKCRGVAGFERIGFDVVMSVTQEDNERLNYTINYAQGATADPGNPTFQIFTEHLDSSAGARLFDRDNPSTSPLKHALKYVEVDYGILAAARKAAFEGNDDGVQIVSDCAKEIGRFNRFRLSPGELSRPSRMPELGEDAAPRLGYEGADLASCLYYMNETEDPALATIVSEVQQVLPNFDGFEFNVVGVDKVAFSMKFSDGRGSINAARMSHGNLIFLGLMVLTYSQNRPPVMLIEEPENGLTPAALKRFYEAVRALAFKNDATQRSQILISSHSPFVMCEAWNGEDQDFIHQLKVEDGHCVIRKLSEAINQQGVVLAKDDSGKRAHLGLRNAEELMSGYLL
jgi:ABC-type branched-subunit amino acid transport system ATPase component